MELDLSGDWSYELHEYLAVEVVRCNNSTMSTLNSSCVTNTTLVNNVINDLQLIIVVP